MCIYQGYLDVEFVGILGISLHTHQMVVLARTARRNHLSIYMSRESEKTRERAWNRAAWHLQVELLEGRCCMKGDDGW